MSAVAGAGPRLELDHLVVACRSLAAARDWCESTFGVGPAPGGRHALMGTHNLLLSVAAPRFPRAYLELIAIDPDAPAPARHRWFDLDDAALQEAIAEEPRLVHWVARTTRMDIAVAAFRDAGFAPGTVVDAERMTPRGPLRWRIALPNGRREAGGAVPLLIEWGDGHAADSLPPSDVSLEAFRISGVPPRFAALFESAAWTADASAPLQARLGSPRDAVTLSAPSLPAA